MTEQAANTIKTIDLDRVVRHLNTNFEKATRALGRKNQKGTELYQLQVDFAHLIHEIQTGPEYLAPKFISEANELIGKIQIAQIEAQKAAKAAKAK